LRYSFNAERKDVILVGEKDINASRKDLCAVVDAIRYKSVKTAMDTLDDVITGGMPIYFRTNNKGMGSRHELGGRKGRYPKKCAAIVKKVLTKAVSTAKNRGISEDTLFVVHAAANKTMIINRSPSKGVSSFGRGMYGYGSPRRSNIEFAKVEIGVSANADMLSKNASQKVERERRALLQAAAKEKAKLQAKQAVKKKPQQAAPTQPPKPPTPKAAAAQPVQK
jgi:ribosomal protein L22